MSKINLTPNASGTGVFTIASPNSNIDYTINLPEISGGEFVATDANGNVGIGTDSPADILTVAGSSTGEVGLTVRNGNGAASGQSAAITFEVSSGTTGDVASSVAKIAGVRTGSGSTGDLTFSTTSLGVPSERMRIDSSGTLLLRTTTAISNDYAINTFGGAGGILIKQSGSSIKALRFENYLGTEVGSITAGLYNAAYNTSSDYRLKENIADLTGAADRLNQIPVRRFNFIVDPDTTIDGFLAHEVADVVPEAITGTKDAVDDEGNPVYQGIDQSKLVPLLTAALQEALTEITDLKARVSALETN